MSSNEGNTKLKRELGLLAATAIVVGNMIGSGIFTASQGLASASSPLYSMVAWLITGTGSMLIALSFAKLGSKFPETGGPIIYTRKAFGEVPAFMVSWTMWVGLWIGNAAIIVAMVRYLTTFIPVINNSPLISFLVASVFLWIFTIINIIGVKETGYISIIATGIKLTGLLVFCIIAIIGFDSSNLSTVSSSEVEGIKTLPSAIAITLWSFVGLESATIAGGEVKNPEKNIRRSTILGTLITTLIYMLISFLSIGALTQGELANSSAPMADILNKITGTNFGGKFIALSILLSGIGTGSGWILSTGRSAYSAAKEGFLPKAFAKVDKKTATPIFALIVSSLLTNVMFLLNFIGLTSAFDFLIMLATLTILPAYAFTNLAEIVLIRKIEGKITVFKFIQKMFIPLITFAYILYAIYGSGAEPAMYTFILLIGGIPIYIYTRMQRNQKIN